MREIVPVHQLKRRVLEQGRIRMGVKVDMGNGKSRPSKLKRFRFTSQDREALDKIAELYGGDVTAWVESETPETFQVTVTTEKIPIVLPPEPLGGSPIYEHWSGGGCLRRCDGVHCTLPVADDARPDAQPAVVDCPCRAENTMLCKARTRLNVMLRDVPFGGVWRLESTGWNAAEELPAQVDLVLAVQGRGFSQGLLSIGFRTRKVRGKTKQFVVPQLSLPDSIAALAAGDLRMSAIGKVREIGEQLRPELEAAQADRGPACDWYDDDDEVVDGELVEDESTDHELAVAYADGPPDVQAAALAETERRRHGVQPPRIKALHAAIRDICNVPEMSGDPDIFRHALVMLVTKGRSQSSNDMTAAEQSEALNVCADLLAGERRLIGLADDGHLRVSARKGRTQP